MTKAMGFKASETSLSVGSSSYQYYSIPAAEKALGLSFSNLPFSLKILLENCLRFHDGSVVTDTHLQAFSNWQKEKKSNQELAYRPARVLMQDFTGVPAIVDLAAMRASVDASGKNPELINPITPVDLVIDHSVQVDHFGDAEALTLNTEKEIERNRERYQFLRWGQSAFSNFRVVPPGTGICHQVNLEFLAKGVWTKEESGQTTAYPDTVVGTDSHTTMINALGVLGWGVGGIEAEAAMLGQPISMIIPQVVGFELTGELREGITATDLVLTITEMLRRKGVVGKFVEFFGSGLDQLPLADRATISNMSPEYGATAGFFPVDQITLDYLSLSGRTDEEVALVKSYTQAQGLWRDSSLPTPQYTDTLSLNLSEVKPSVAGPKRPQDRVVISDLKSAFDSHAETETKDIDFEQSFPVKSLNEDVHHGDVVIAAITSCTNTSNPSVLIAAALVAKKASELGMKVPAWVKTSFAPGSKVVTSYLAHSGLQPFLDKLGFNLVGYGCTTCIGNSGPLHDELSDVIKTNDLTMASVLSGNRNFEGRVHPLVKTNWLASPPLVVAYALAGTIRLDIQNDPIQTGADGKEIFLKDIWPSNDEVASIVSQINANMFQKGYEDVFTGDEAWQNIATSSGKTYQWDSNSTYVQHPPFFASSDSNGQTKPIQSANILALLGDSITTDHISPAGAIAKDSPAAKYLESKGVSQKDFNSYGARRGNHEVMMRGTFANIRIKNEMAEGKVGGYTKHIPSDEVMPIYDAAMKYQAEGSELVVIAGKEYGTGSSRDWAAKGTKLLGVRAVIAESYERIHRSNLIGMGVLPLQFEESVNRTSLNLTGAETISIGNLESLAPQGHVSVQVTYPNGESKEFKALCRIDTPNELAYYQTGGILSYVLEDIIASN